MGLTLRWVNEDEYEKVAETRLRAFGGASRELPQFIERVRGDRVSGPGDFLLAERQGAAVGTATHVPLQMWVRGGRVSCQGVAFVGTVRTARRKLSGEHSGVGTAVMREVVRSARERGCVLSALMPFRASYYEHFGYGLVERRMEWTLPMSVLPNGPFEHFRDYRHSDLDALLALRQRIAERGQCDIERHRADWDRKLELAHNGWFIIERDGDGADAGPMRSATFFDLTHHQNLDTVRVVETLYEDLPALRRVLHFLSSLRDQYSFATLHAPQDLPLNLLLKETQMTHRASRNHPTPEARPYTRMQVRVLDHARLLEAMMLPADAPDGKTVVEIHEVEGAVMRLAVEIAGGRARATATDASPQAAMPDRVWSMIVLGDVPAARAAEMGLLSASEQAVRVLDAFSRGPAPWCGEYF
jgi:predicted acetyltransferase